MAQIATPLNTDHLVGAFVALLRESLTAQEFFSVQIRNATVGEGACESHFYCDANVVMDQAFTAIAGREIALDESEQGVSDTGVWNAAWETAKAAYLTDTTTTIATLTAEYADWCAAEGVEPIDADELAQDDTLSGAQRQWLGWFIQRWEIVQDAERLV